MVFFCTTESKFLISRCERQSYKTENQLENTPFSVPWRLSALYCAHIFFFSLTFSYHFMLEGWKGKIKAIENRFILSELLIGFQGAVKLLVRLNELQVLRNNLPKWLSLYFIN